MPATTTTISDNVVNRDDDVIQAMEIFDEILNKYRHSSYKLSVYDELTMIDDDDYYEDTEYDWTSSAHDDDDDETLPVRSYEIIGMDDGVDILVYSFRDDEPTKSMLRSMVASNFTGDSGYLTIGFVTGELEYVCTFLRARPNAVTYDDDDDDDDECARFDDGENYKGASVSRVDGKTMYKFRVGDSIKKYIRDMVAHEDATTVSPDSKTDMLSVGFLAAEILRVCKFSARVASHTTTTTTVATRIVRRSVAAVRGARSKFK
jgi:hypothetical protein